MWNTSTALRGIIQLHMGLIFFYKGCAANPGTTYSLHLFSLCVIDKLYHLEKSEIFRTGRNAHRAGSVWLGHNLFSIVILSSPSHTLRTWRVVIATVSNRRHILLLLAARPASRTQKCQHIMHVFKNITYVYFYCNSRLIVNTNNPCATYQNISSHYPYMDEL